MSKTSKPKRVQTKTAGKNNAKQGRARKTNFKIKAAPGCVVYVAGTFNGWDPIADKLAANGDGYYIGSLMLSEGRYEYKYVVDGNWCLDPECLECVPNECGSHNHVLEIC